MKVRTYRITVEGELSDPLKNAFDGMTLERARGETSLTGPVRDQVKLQGLLQRISDLGLTLLSVRVLGLDEEAAEER